MRRHKGGRYVAMFPTKKGNMCLVFKDVIEDFKKHKELWKYLNERENYYLLEAHNGRVRIISVKSGHRWRKE